MAERHVRDVLGEALRRGGWVRAMRRADAVLRWPEVVGREVARFARAVALQSGTLVVEVADAETAMHLGLQRQRILDAYRTRYGDADVRDLRFRVGGTAPTAATDPRPRDVPVEVDPVEVAHLTEGLGALPEGLAAPADAAGRALATGRARRRAAGWRPCPICGSLADPSTRPGAPPPFAALVPSAGRQLCPACARHAATPKVQGAATRLLVAPGAATPALTDDERAVARALALARAERAQRELLPHVLADPSARAPLERLVRCTVALRRGVDLADVGDVDDVDATRDGIDPRVLARARPAARARPPGGSMTRPVLLVVLDGFGLAEPGPANAVALARTPVFDRIWADGPHTTLEASGPAVGLPAGQMGNSEVGHLNLGAGRVVPQSLTFVQDRIDDGSLFANPVLVDLCDAAAAAGGTLHLMGLVSDGGVHSDLTHLEALIELARRRGLERVADPRLHGWPRHGARRRARATSSASSARSRRPVRARGCAP